MATGKPPYSKQTFIRLFDSIARHKHRYTVFSDFAVMAGIALHNTIPACRSEARVGTISGRDCESIITSKNHNPIIQR